jgi:hypothetical protein
MNEPRTEAGRALLDDLQSEWTGALRTVAVKREMYGPRIAAIEAEAVAPYLAVVKRAEALMWDVDHKHPTTTILRQQQALRDALGRLMDEPEDA